MTFSIGTPFTRGAGYFLNNKDGPAKSRQEADVATCTHCQRVVFLQQWKDDGGFCHKCQAPICGPCADRALTEGCVPFVKQIEEYAERAMRYEQYKLERVGLPESTTALILPGDPSFKE